MATVRYNLKASEKFTKKLISLKFKTISTNWIVSTVYWVVDSKYRRQKAISKYLEEQVKFANQEIREFAEQFSTMSYDKRIVEILKAVHSKVKYKTDYEKYGQLEKWESVNEVWDDEVADCESVHALIYVIARLSGMPSMFIYATLGDTYSGYHFYLVYLSTNRNDFFIMDGTYGYPSVDLRTIRYRNPYYQTLGYKPMDYISNEDYTLKTRDN